MGIKKITQFFYLPPNSGPAIPLSSSRRYFGTSLATCWHHLGAICASSVQQQHKGSREKYKDTLDLLESNWRGVLGMIRKVNRLAICGCFHG